MNYGKNTKMSKVIILSTPSFNDNWVYTMFKQNTITEKLDKLLRRIIFTTSSSQTLVERSDILRVKSMIGCYPTTQIRERDMIECNRLWKKYSK
jgi:hypothetical protein